MHNATQCIGTNLVNLVHCERYRRSNGTVGSLVRVTCTAQCLFNWFTSVCYRRKVSSVAAGLAQMVHLCVLTVEAFARGSLRCVTGAGLALLFHSFTCVCYRFGLAGGHLRVLQAQGWLSCFIHLCVLQVWLSWGSLTFVTGAGVAQLVHLCVSQAWLSWGSLRCVTGAGLA
jgi:hypothetical protein